MQIFPPAVCRLLARTPKSRGQSQRPLTDREIADRSGLGVDIVRSLSWAGDWNNVPAPMMVRFVKGCGLDFDRPDVMRRHLKLVRNMTGRWKTGRHYLRRDPEWETKWCPMIDNFIESRKAS